MPPDVARHACGREQQRHQRDEKCNHQPAHEVKTQASSIAVAALPSVGIAAQNRETAVAQNTRPPARPAPARAALRTRTGRKRMHGPKRRSGKELAWIIQHLFAMAAFFRCGCRLEAARVYLSDKSASDLALGSDRGSGYNGDALDCSHPSQCVGTISLCLLSRLGLRHAPLRRSLRLRRRLPSQIMPRFIIRGPAIRCRAPTLKRKTTSAP